MGQWYELEVILSGDTATLEVGGVEKVSHTFASGIDGGPVGLRMANAHTHFDDVYVKEVVSVRKYCFFGGRRVAMRRDGMVQYIVADHLGTTSLVLDAQGDKVAESRHLPYGGERWRSPKIVPFRLIFVLHGNVECSGMEGIHQGQQLAAVAIAVFSSPSKSSRFPSWHPQLALAW